MRISSSFRVDRGGLSTFINPYSFLTLLQSGEFDRVSREFKVYVDGILLVWISHFLLGKRVERISFDDTSIAPLVFDAARKNGHVVGVVGSRPEVIEMAARIIREKYGLSEVVFHHGYFSEGQLEVVASQFMRCDVIVCSMGTPRQEQTLIYLKDVGWQGAGYTCGGFFDQLVSAGGGSYYPVFIDRLNLRWAYRLCREPCRLWRRYVFDYPVGAFAFFLAVIRKRISFE